MKMIVAYIHGELLDDVVHALRGVEGLTGATATEARGFGKWLQEESDKEVEREPRTLRANVRLEVICAESISAEVERTIARSAHTGRRGDGIIARLEVLESIDIRTGEHAGG